MKENDSKYGKIVAIRSGHDGNDDLIEFENGILMPVHIYTEQFGKESTETEILMAIYNTYRREHLDDELVAVYKNVTGEYAFRDKGEHLYKIMSKQQFELAQKYGLGFCPCILGGAQYGIFREERYFYKTKDECDKEVSEMIDKKQKELDRHRNKVGKSKRYENLGTITVPTYETEQRGNVFEKDGKEAVQTGEISIELTQGELVNAGILPEDIQWTPNTRVSAKNIADADKKQALTTTEVGGAKGFMKKLLDKFKGIGEK